MTPLCPHCGSKKYIESQMMNTDFEQIHTSKTCEDCDTEFDIVPTK